MLASFTITLIECLEIALITLLLTRVADNLYLYLFAAGGLAIGVFAAVVLHDYIEDYEWAGYALLSAMLFYLFFRGKDMAKHAVEHVAEIRNATGLVVVLLTVITIYARESFEIMSALLFNPNSSYAAAAAGAALAVIAFFVGRTVKSVNKFIFTWGHWAYLALAVWFGYEAVEHLHWL